MHTYVVSAGLVYVHTHTVTLGTVLPFVAHLLFRCAPCLKIGWKKSEKSLGVSAVNEVGRGRSTKDWTHKMKGYSTTRYRPEWLGRLVSIDSLR